MNKLINNIINISKGLITAIYNSMYCACQICMHPLQCNISYQDKSKNNQILNYKNIMICDECIKKICFEMPLEWRNYTSNDPYILYNGFYSNKDKSNISKRIILKIKRNSIVEIERFYAMRIAHQIFHFILKNTINKIENVFIIPVPSNNHIFNFKEKRHIKNICDFIVSMLNENLNDNINCDVVKYLDILSLKPYSIINKMMKENISKKARISIKKNTIINTNIIVSNSIYIIIDDVYTTGETIMECVRALHNYFNNQCIQKSNEGYNECSNKIYVSALLKSHN